MPSCPATVRDELRRAAALYLFNGIHSKPGMKKAQQQAEMGRRWKGEGNVSSHLELLSEGRRPYDGLFQRDTDGVVNPSKPLYLKSEFSPNPEQILIVGKDITRELLEKTSYSGTLLVSGPQLHRTAQRSMANIRKAIAIAKEFVNEDGMDRRGTGKDS